MQKKDIKKIFSSHISVPFGTKPPSAVLVPLMEKENGINVVFTQRALHMIHQPGDICFPGGHHENDETAEETAIRETYEELGIKKRKHRNNRQTRLYAYKIRCICNTFYRLFKKYR